MRTILVPTDFSNNANNALKYANIKMEDRNSRMQATSKGMEWPVKIKINPKNY